jgi:hypothetical protein
VKTFGLGAGLNPQVSGVASEAVELRHLVAKGVVVDVRRKRTVEVVVRQDLARLTVPMPGEIDVDGGRELARPPRLTRLPGLLDLDRLEGLIEKDRGQEPSELLVDLHDLVRVDALGAEGPLHIEAADPTKDRRDTAHVRREIAVDRLLDVIAGLELVGELPVVDGHESAPSLSQRSKETKRAISGRGREDGRSTPCRR